MAKHSHRVIPLFPLGINVLPGELIPLHIFENRYRKLLAYCLHLREQGFAPEFGVLLSNGKTMKERGCVVSVVEILRQYEDGRSDIVVQGKRLFELIHVLPDEEFPRAHVEEISERENCPTDEQYAEMFALVVEFLESVGIAEPLPDSATRSAFELASACRLDVFERQELLVQPDEVSRLDVLKSMVAFRVAVVDRNGPESVDEIYCD
ncbi:MAG: LON peptidase substrate-binding domain-containing protein [Bdellovibrionales bacterium]|nr:LON peptidase substrate-binding domain-containing protein [Bdellovibrionales bacterium]